MRQGPRAFSRFSTSDSDVEIFRFIFYISSYSDIQIHISCQEKDEPAFEPLQGNPAFFRVSTSHGTDLDSPRGIEAQYGRLSRGVGDPRSLSTCHRDIGILSIFKRSQPSSNFEASISPRLSRY